MQQSIKLQIKNFRSLEDIEISLKPNILLFGKNASGKSSLLKAVNFFANYLLRVLNYESQVTDPYIHLIKPALLLNNNSIFNSFEDIVTNNDTKRKIDFIIKITDNKNSVRTISDVYKSDIISGIHAQSVNLDYLIKNAKDDRKRRVSLSIDADIFSEVEQSNVEKEERSNFSAHFTFKDDKNEFDLLKNIRFDCYDEKFTFCFTPRLVITDENMYPHLDAKIEFQEDDFEAICLKEFFKNNLSIIPEFQVRSVNDPTQKELERVIIKEIVSYFVRKTKSNNDDFMSLNLDEKIVLFNKFLKVCDLIFIHIPRTISDIFSRSMHIPSVRELPRHSYELAGGRFSENDYYGILKRLDEDLFQPRLIDRINKQLVKHFEMDEIIKIYKDKERKLAGCINTINLKNKTISNLSNASSGIQQILPILFFLLDDYAVSIFTCEQPELHLHPNLQTKLAAFLVSENTNGSKKLIETHSEHIVRKIQVLIAQGKLSRQSVAIYYFDKEKKSGVTSIKEMEIDEKGRFTTDWPPGFFDTDTQLALEFFREISKN